MRSLALRLRAWVALCSFVGGLTLPFVADRSLTFADDAACGLEVLAVGPAGAHFEAPATPAPSGHCALCHWLRAVSGARPGPAILVSAHLDVVPFRVALIRHGHGAVVSTDRASRAPPARVA